MNATSKMKNAAPANRDGGFGKRLVDSIPMLNVQPPVPAPMMLTKGEMRADRTTRLLFLHDVKALRRVS